MPPKKKVKAEKADSKEMEEDDKEKNEEEDKEEVAEEEDPEEEEKDEDDEEESEDEESEEEVDHSQRGRGKRKRRSTTENSFEPEDFTMTEIPLVTIIKGRGKKLRSLAAVKANIEKNYSINSEEMAAAHKFLFGNRRVPKKEMKANILDFSGYLKSAPKSYDAKKLDMEDEDVETKYSKKAFKMPLIQIRMLCDFFHVVQTSDNGKTLTKDDMIDNLLDFLGQPNADFLKPEAPQSAPARRKSSSTPRKVTKQEPPPEPKDPFELVRGHEKGKKASDEALRQWVRAYVVCFDMDSATTKHAIKTASDKFGIDLTKSKERLKELLAEEM